MNKRYQIIYADPPWSYNDKRTHSGKNNPNGAGGAEKHYETMDYEAIANLPIQDIADENCHLFLWATMPLLNEAMYVLKRWGFKYVTVVFVWIKMKNDMSAVRGDGIGAYTLNNAEIVLLGRKGKYTRASTKVKQIIQTPKTKHSEKPPDIRNRIVELIGDLPRIELFARQKTDGWDVWGNEITNDINL